MLSLSLDYLTIRVPAPMKGRGDQEDDRHVAWYAMRLELPQPLYAWLRTLTFIPHEPKGGYSAWHQDPSTRAVLKWMPEYDYVWVELPGRACNALMEAGALNAVGSLTPSHVRRFDLATDIGDIPPSEIIAAGYSPRFGSMTNWKSATGHTCYVGSMKSSRYARVYQYAPPHPRAGCTRIEYVFQNDAAAWAVQMVSEVGWITLARAAATVWAWKHDAARPDQPMRISATATNSRQTDAGRLRWLYSQVIPALRRMIADGLIEASEVASLLAAPYRGDQAGDPELPD